MFSCSYCTYTDNFAETVNHQLQTHPSQLINFKEEILYEDSGHLCTKIYSWPFNPSEVTPAYDIVANSLDRTLIFQPKHSTSYSKIDTNNDNSSISYSNLHQAELPSPRKLPKQDSNNSPFQPQDTTPNVDKTDSNTKLLADALPNLKEYDKDILLFPYTSC